MEEKYFGQSVPRKEGREKVTGRARYIDDISFPDMLYGVTVRSSGARGRIRDIRFGEGIPWNEFTIVTAPDIPGKNEIALIEHDQPCLVAEIFNHPEEAILLLAHPDRYLLEEARRAVHIEVEPLPAIFSIDDSLAKEVVLFGEDNIFKSYLLEKGDVDAAWAKADIIVEGEYRTGAQEQLYIENQGMIAEANPTDGVTIWGSLQCPYYVQKALITLFGLPAEKIRVVQAETGGGFGGKEDYPSMIAGHAALLAWKSGKRVKIIYDRAEDMVSTTKRHPSRTRHRTGITHDGKLVAMDIDFVLEGGAYATLSSVVLSRGTIHAAGPYVVPNLRVHARAVATNTPPHGAFRGFGAPQAIFAIERHMDQMALAVNLTPEEFRRRNLLHRGDTTATGQVVNENVNFDVLLNRAFRESDYHAKRARFAKENPGATVKRGIGFASFMHGAGFTGSGEVYLASIVDVEATAEGIVRVLAASTEIGQGTNTVFSQIAADALGIALDRIEIARPDTSAVPNSGPTVASRTSMVVGNLVEKAALGIKRQLVDAGLLCDACTEDEFVRACKRFIEARGPLRSSTKYEAPPGLFWDDKKYNGDAYGTYTWAVYVAEVAVDTVTFEARVIDFVAVQEVGKVIHPVFAAGQIEGGVAQAIGMALYENVVYREGRMANGQMTNYIMPTAADIPPIRVFFEEQPYPFGPHGAKGIGELPMDGPAAAIVNAIQDATGTCVREIPATPEVLMEAMTDKAGALV
jgi:CO/xanthine dehydrogenase Mo-binding subunit